MFEKIRNSKFEFVKNFRVFTVISIILVAVGIVGLVLLPFGVTLFNLDIDFLGGVTLEYNIGVPVTSEVTDAVRDIVHEVTGEYPASVTKAGDAGTTVNVKATEMSSEEREAVFERVAQAYGGAELITSEYVSAVVGNDLRNAAIIASVAAAAGILIYITIRFELRSGLAAVCCLIHDILAMLSMYIIFQIPFNMNFIAAALTILGYSINATIVVYDRVRENNKTLGGKGDFAQVVDLSIRQTMARSVNTTVTTLLPVICILILGVQSIRNFAWPLLIGIVCGGYSSICLAGPLWCKFRGGRKST